MKRQIQQIVMGIMQTSGSADFIPALVVSDAPLRIKIKDNDKLILEDEQLILSETVSEKALASGDSVMLGQLQGGQQFFVIDKIAR
ncbi:DUF2577 family protein [Listeria booriae]|uniref:DUF2577 family protein n=1 Tax=Listeria booriae TaxID=1552123 RepID=A0A842CZA8_9LIST|nr:DUF2577 family protein [Listeria booriae]MBC1209464.1 DUF2577 family protein [Listeria booriae]MBC1233167.1 DUF2577 family protein [Listeria booriae]MBC1523556.1 DUF2577 family protein [Listeria booriae]MBC2004453.1 DUF2577 family protein [Listeria booriae]MBC2369963.1 DUF2577 family protein [Listeria booriae]